MLFLLIRLTNEIPIFLIQDKICLIALIKRTPFFGNVKAGILMLMIIYREIFLILYNLYDSIILCIDTKSTQ